MFFGEFTYKIDEKSRVSIPPKFRQQLRNGTVLTQGVESCITAYPVIEWKKLAEDLTTGSITRSKLRQLNRAIFATAYSIEIDRQGRIALPSPLREYAEIEDEVVIAGANNYFELWNRDQWLREKALSREQAWQIIESLNNN